MLSSKVEKIVAFAVLSIVALFLAVMLGDKTLRTNITNEGQTQILKNLSQKKYEKVTCVTEICKEYNAMVDTYATKSTAKSRTEMEKLFTTFAEKVEPEITKSSSSVFGIWFWLSVGNGLIVLLASSRSKIAKTSKEQISLAESKLLEETKMKDSWKEKFDQLYLRYSPLMELELEIIKLRDHKTNLNSEITSMQSVLDEQGLKQVGFYYFRYDFNDSKKYEEALSQLKEKEKTLLKSQGALVWNGGKRFNGLSEKECTRLTRNLDKLALMAFLGEVDVVLNKVRYDNVESSLSKVENIAKSIEKLLEEYQVTFRRAFLNYKKDEISLVHEYQVTVQEEKEEQRLIREQMKEEEKALKEAQKAQEDAEKEERNFQKALEKAKEDLQKNMAKDTEANNSEFLVKIQELEAKLLEAQAQKERAKSQAELTRQGHVYVISNIGSFGENVYKIGMTRRLDPMDRVKELGDASVPFEFDVHALIFCDDAPALERQLHSHFNSHRVNQINEKKEFFKVSLDEVETACRNFCKNEFKLTKAAEAKDYNLTLAKINTVKA